MLNPLRDLVLAPSIFSVAPLSIFSVPPPAKAPPLQLPLPVSVIKAVLFSEPADICRLVSVNGVAMAILPPVMLVEAAE